MLVEDDLDISETIQTIFEEENYKLKSVFNGKEALDYLASTEQMPVLILLDVMMPLMNGYEFRIAQLQDPKIAKIPTILLSAAGNIKDLKKLNFNDFLKKPLELETLLAVVKKYF